MTTRTIYPPSPIDFILTPSKINRSFVYRVLLLLPLLTGMVFSFIGLKGVFDAPEGVLKYGEKSLTVTYPTIHMGHFLSFAALASFFVLLVVIITLGLNVIKLENIEIMPLMVAISVFAVLFTAFGLMESSKSSKVMAIESSSLEAIVDSNLGNDYEVVKSDYEVTYLDSDNVSYEFVKTIGYGTITWTLEEVK